MKEKIINGSGLVKGRLASFVAKELLKGEKIVILNCDKVIITGSKKNIQKEFAEKRSKIGSSQKGPKHPRSSEKIIKRSVRGMLPNHRFGRGREAWKNLKCYKGIPKQYEKSEFLKLNKPLKNKFVNAEVLSK